MLKQLYANNSLTTLASPVSPSDTTIQVASSVAFPVPSTNQFFLVTIDSGTSVEIIAVYTNTTGSGTLSNCLRGQEGTTAQNFQVGTKVECRVTKGTLSQFARYQDRLAQIATVDDLSTPTNSDANSYVCTSTDDVGNPVLAIAKTNSTWRFTNYSTTVLSDSVQAGSTTTKVAFAGASGPVSLAFAGKYILQFTSGVNAGLARAVTGSDNTGITWSKALAAAPSTGDSFEVYQSTASLLNSLIQSSEDGLIFAVVMS